ncbi:hypothetical protein [Cerasicoccus frondis]|uniref:hypothetical protein n=1 Tax=Cerasicoccus frondis TaxID=490090 RepID=UPI00285269ED|nr:hypothetical protein [Cerasicoccus frondis]
MRLLRVFYISALMASGYLFANPNTGTYHHPDREARLTITSIYESPDNEGYWRVEYDVWANEGGSFMNIYSNNSEDSIVIYYDPQNTGPYPYTYDIIKDFKAGTQYYMQAQNAANVASGTWDPIVETPPEEFPYYHIISDFFPNKKESILTYYLELNFDDGQPTQSTTVSLNQYEAMQFAAAGASEHTVTVYEVVDGSNVFLGNVHSTLYGNYTEEEMPAQQDLWVSVTEIQPDDVNDYEPPTLDPEFRDITSDVKEGVVDNTDYQPFSDTGITEPVAGDHPFEYAQQAAWNMDALMRQDQMLWEKTNEAQDERFARLDAQQAQRHEEAVIWQKNQVDAQIETTDTIQQESDQTQMQLAEVVDELEEGNDKLDKLDKLDDIDEKLGQLVEDSDYERDLRDNRPSESDMSTQGNAAKDQQMTAFDDYSIPSGIPDVSPDTLDLSVSLGGQTISLNPFDYPEFTELAAFVKRLIFWFSFLFYCVFCISLISHLSLETLRLKQAKGNPVFGGTGGQVTALIAAGLITAAVWAVPTILYGLFSPQYGDLSWFSIGGTSPVDTGGFSSFIQMAVSMVLAFIPVGPIIALVFQYIALRIWGTATILSIASVVRFITP